LNNVTLDEKLSNKHAQNSTNTRIPQEMSGASDGRTTSNVSLLTKHISFDERDAPEILDVLEEQLAAERAFVPKDPLEDVFDRISLLRKCASMNFLFFNISTYIFGNSLCTSFPFKGGQEGVFDLHELVEVLHLCRARHLCVIAVPPEAKYVDYMLIVTGKSQRHMLAMAEFVRRVYKQKRNPEDIVPKIEGKNCKNWMALDLGLYKIACPPLPQEKQAEPNNFFFLLQVTWFSIFFRNQHERCMTWKLCGQLVQHMTLTVTNKRIPLSHFYNNTHLFLITSIQQIRNQYSACIIFHRSIYYFVPVLPLISSSEQQTDIFPVK